jgi:ankyrin repeat protein
MNSRSNIRTLTQLSGPSTLRLSSDISTVNQAISNDLNNNILFSIITGNVCEVKKLVNKNNINNIIDTKNNYTALHYAVKLPNNEIVEYLVNCGANVNLKQNEGKDAIDLSIEANKRFLINKLITDTSKDSKELDELYVKYDDVNYKFKNLEKTNKTLKDANEYLEKVNEELKENNSKLKRKLEDSETAFENLLKKTKK